MTGSSAFNTNFEHIYDIPQIVKKRLAHILDKDNKWVGLALRQMGYDEDVVESIQRCTLRSGQSPTEQLLIRWGNLNHTITELFVVLSRENIFPAMEIIKRFVAPKYHILFLKANDTPEVLNGSAVKSSKQEDKAAAVMNPPPLEVPPGLPTFNFEDLQLATNGWSDRHVLGRGGFGVVYRGMFRNTIVAIKMIKHPESESACAELRQSINEMKFLNNCRHENVVQLLGYSMSTDGNPCVVSQFMPGGSLDSKLFPKTGSGFTPLSIIDRVTIAIGTAKGLQYLHTFTNKPVIHGDIKPGNILLDNANVPKIGDFGLTRELPMRDSTMMVSRAYGTGPYIPSEFITRLQLSVKVDSYSFGLVLYEIVTGQRVYSEKRNPRHIKEMITLDDIFRKKFGERLEVIKFL